MKRALVLLAATISLVATAAISSERATRVSHASGAGHGAPASEREGGSGGAKPPGGGQDRAAARQALIARAKSLELNTPYVPPPGDAMAHHASGYAKIMCSAVFITGLEPEFAAQNVGGFTSPFGERSKVGKPVVDRAEKAVHVTLPNGVTRTASTSGARGA